MPPTPTIDELEDLVTRLSGLADALDLSTCNGPGAARLFRAFERCARVADAGKALAAARVDETMHWRALRARSPQEWLSQESGGSAGRNRDLLKRGEAMSAMPELASAAVAGDVAPEALDKIARVVPVNRGAAVKLLQQAKAGTDLESIRKAATETLARAEGDAARAERLRKGRRLREWTDDEGFWRLDVAASPHLGARFRSLLDPWIEAEFQRARAEERRESMENYAFDGLLAMADASAHGGVDAGGDDVGEDVRPARLRRLGRTGSDTKMIVHVDHSALRRGHAIDGETCEVAGFGPIPVSVARELIESGDVFLAAVLTDGKDVFNVAHLGRRPTAYQRTALQWKYRECAVEGCHRITLLEDDHIDAWALSGVTDVKQLQRLCRFHHRQKSERDCRTIAAVRDGLARADADPRVEVGPQPETDARPETDAHSEADARATLTSAVPARVDAGARHDDEPLGLHGVDQGALFDAPTRGDPGAPGG